MKRPAFQFYPSDWRKDMALQSCSVAARGLWMDMLCIAHECEPYGHLTVNGRPMTAAQIGRHTGLTERECAKLIAELEDAGVLSRTDDGAIFSRRMVRDEDVRNRRGEGGKAGAVHGAKGAEHGSKGGRPPKLKGPAKGGSETPLPLHEEPPPSSSSSTSTSGIQEGDLSPTSSREPTARAAVGMALKRAGIDVTRLNLADPRLQALIDQGATPEEFEGIAREAVQESVDKPLGWICTVLTNRRAKAAALQLANGAPAPATKTDRIGQANAALARRLAERTDS